MTVLRPVLRPVDRTRAGQLLLAFAGNDREAIGPVMSQLSRDPAGVGGCLFALAGIAVALAVEADPDHVVDRIAAALVDLTDPTQN